MRYNADGSLDTTFGTGGKILTPTSAGSLNDYGNSVTVQADGKIVVAGQGETSGAGDDVVVVRYNVDGTLDTGFGTGGKIVTPVGTGTSGDVGNSVKVQADGKIVVAGYGTGSGTGIDFAVVRYNANGTLDTTFGTGGTGKILTPVGTGTSGDTGTSVMIQADGKIVVAGYGTGSGTGIDVAVVRYNANGSLDTTFGTDGKILTPVGAGTSADLAYSVTVQADGKIVVAGLGTGNGTGNDVAVVRYNANGSLDTTFGPNGTGTILTPVVPGSDAGKSVIVQADGKIVVAGYGQGSGTAYDFAVVRYNADGSLDTTFNAPNSLGGTVAFIENGAAVILDSDVTLSDTELDALQSGAGDYAGATLTLARQGGANAQDTFGFGAATFTVSGNDLLDTNGAVFATFTDTAGTLTVTFTGTEVATSALADAVARAVTYANTSEAPASSVTLAWTFSDGNAGDQGPDGAATTTGTTTVTITAANDAPLLTGTQATLLAGTEDTAFTVTAAQLLEGFTDPEGTALVLSNLSVDHGTIVSDGAGGYTVTPAADYNGPLVISYSVGDGAASIPATLSTIFTAVNDAPSFNGVGTGKVLTPASAGTLNDFGQSVTIQADGKIIVAGLGEGSGTGNDFTVVRYNTDGSLDTTFGTGGKILTPVGAGTSTDFAQSVTVQADGKIVVAGQGANSTTGDDFAVVRYNADGSLDTTFGTGGKILTPVGTGMSRDSGQSVKVQVDGKIVVAGYGGGNGDDFAVVRYNADGSLDTTFGTGGKVLTPVGTGTSNDIGNSLTVQEDGKIIVAGYGGGSDGTDFAVVRYNADGSLDTTFGTGGTGKILTPVGAGTSNDFGNSVTVQADGKIVVAGYGASSQAGNDFAVVRYTANGTLDTTFGTGGKIVTPIGAGTSNDYAYSVTVQADGKIIVAGQGFGIGTSNDFAVVRYTANGTLDTTFGPGGTGKILTPVGTGADTVKSVIVQADGKIVVAGYGQGSGTGYDFAVVRYNADGSLDTTFGLQSSLGGTVAFTENGAAVILDSDVTLSDAELDALQSGAGDYAGATLTLARQGGADASDTFGFGASTFTVSGNDLLDTNGTVFATFTDTAGTLTVTFTGTNVATSDLAEAVARAVTYANTSDAPASSVTLAWTFSDGNTGAQGPDGAATATGTTTVTITAANDVPLLTGTQATLLAGTEDTAFTVRAVDLLQGFADPEDTTLVLSNLSVDHGTIVGDGAGGYTVTPAANYSGQITISYSVGDGVASTPATLSTVIAPLNDAPSFSGVGTGVVLTPVGAGTSTDTGRSVTVQADGKIVVAGVGTGIGTGTDFAVVRYNADGSLDTTFGTGGKILTPIGTGTAANAGYSVTVQADGKIVVAGYGSGNATGTDFAVVRYNTDGSLDTGFGTGGKIVTPVGTTTSSDTGRSVTIQADGKIVVAGQGQGSGTDIAVVRYNADGSLDTTFGTGGKILTPVGTGTGTSNDAGYGVTVQADGKIVVAGFGVDSGTSNDFAVVRYNANGTLDTGFGPNGTGKILTPVGTGTSNDYGQSVVIQADGKIVVVGYGAGSGGTDFAVVRYNVNGSLDTTFGTDGTGKILTPVGADRLSDIAQSVTVQADGKIVVAGYGTGTGGQDFAVVRYNANGSLDAGFGTGGKILTPVGTDTSSDLAYSVTVQADGKIVVTGYGQGSGTGTDVAVVRYNADGSLDTTFGLQSSLGGTVAFTENGSSVRLDSDVTLSDLELDALQSGAGDYAGATLTLARQGGADASDTFGFGASTFTVSGNDLLDTNGAVFATFTDTAGTLTVTFTGTEVATSDLADAVARAVTYANTSEAPASSVTLAWTFSDGNAGDQGPDGAATTTGTTTVTITAANDAPLLTGSQAILTGGTEDTAFTVRAVDLLQGFADPEGTALVLSDLSVDHGTIVSDGAGGYTVTPAANYSGQITISYSVGDGVASTPATLSTVIAPLNDAPSFNGVGTGVVLTPVGAGTSYDSGQSVAVQGDGKIVVAGYGQGNGTGYDVALVRYNADGSLDTTFGPDGTGKILTPVGTGASSDGGSSVTVQADGKIVVAGYGNGSGGQDFALVRYNADGSLDTGFGPDGTGKILTPVNTGTSGDVGNSVTMQADGKIVVAGYRANSGETGNDFALVRYNADGSLDTGFGTGGKILTPVGTGTSFDLGSSVTVQADGKVVVAGYGQGGGGTDFAVVRYNADGSLDTSFGPNGTGKILTPVGAGTGQDQGNSVTVQTDGSILVAGYGANGGNGIDVALVRYKTDGSLDTGFGPDGTGKILTPVGAGASSDVAYSITVQADGKIIVAGFGDGAGTGSDFALIRYNANGSLDTSFGPDGTGKITTPVGTGTSQDIGQSVMVQTDGKIVVVGRGAGNNTGNDFAVVRYNADGSLDTTFNLQSSLGGTVAFTENGAAVILDSDVTLSDAELDALQSGAGDYAGATLTLARQGGADASDTFGFGASTFTVSGNDLLDTNGAVFATFTDTAGTLTVTFTGTNVATSDLADAVARAVTYANTSEAPASSVTLAWTFSDGNAGAQGPGGAATTTGTTTVTITPVNDAPLLTGAQATLVAGTEDTAFIVTEAQLLQGFADPEGTTLVLSDLSVDHGTIVSDGADGYTVTPDVNYSGPIVISYNVGDGAASTPAFLSTTLEAMNDAPSFSGVGTGVVLTPVGADGSSDVGQSVTVQADGKILVAGYGDGTGGSDFVLVRYNADGSLDTGFGPDGTGKILTPAAPGTASDYGRSVALQTDGKIVVAGYGVGADNRYDFALVRYDADGSLDTGFGPDGTGTILTSVGTGLSSDIAYSVTVQTDGKIVVAGYGEGSGGQDFALVRYNADGSLDTGFGPDGTGKILTPISAGTASDQGNSVTLQADGKIVVVGSGWGNGQDFAAVRYNTDGSLDTGFGPDGTGKILTPVGVGTSNDAGYSVTVQADGKILVAGYGQGSGTGYDFALVRYNTNGTLDTGFGPDATGKILTPVGADTASDFAYNVTFQADGKILVAGEGMSSGSQDFTLVRYNADGSLDTGFGPDGTGKILTPVSDRTAEDIAKSITVQADGKIVVAGYGIGSGTGYDFAVVRYNADGSLDTTFNLQSSLGGTVAFTENGAAVILDSDVILSDAELDALQSGVGDYTGATLTLARQGGANAQDTFGFGASTFTVSGNDLLDTNGATFATFTDTAGTLTVTFTGTEVATSDLAEAVARAVTYANTSDTPPTSATLVWTFSDGNTGAQGSGGVGTTTGTTTVTITAVNDAPRLTGTQATLAAGREDTAYTGLLSNLLKGFTDTDTDSATLAVTNLRADHGTVTITGGTFTLTPDADYNGLVTLSYDVGDGTAITAATRALTLVSVNDAPVATDDVIEVVQRNSVASGVLGNDIDPDSGTLTITAIRAVTAGTTRTAVDGEIVIAGRYGTLTLKGNGSYTYEANAEGRGAVGASVVDDFLYTLSDGQGGADSSHLRVTVTGSNRGDAGNNVFLLTGPGTSASGYDGDDTYIVDDAGDRVIEAADGGTDMVRTSVSFTLSAGQEIETLRTMSDTGLDAIRLGGNAFANTLIGNAGDNVLNGGAGADRLYGYAGDDSYIVDDASDRVFETDGGGTDMVRTSVSFTLSAGQEIETLRTMSDTGLDAIRLGGNAFANTLIGNAGDNVLNGGAGADRLYGYAGDDSYIVDDASDRVFETDGGGTDMVRTSVSFTLSAGQEIETLRTMSDTGLDAIRLGGNAFANTLIGNAGDNVLNGGAGADRLYGYAGDDSYIVDDASDRVFETDGGGTDMVRTSVSFTLSAGQEIETLRTMSDTGLDAIRLGGNAFANTLIGNAGDNVLNGGAGADRLYGYAGDDSYIVDDASDRVFETDGGGTDMVRTSVSFTLSAGQEIETLRTMSDTGLDAIRLGGNAFANTLIGNAGDNVLNGGAGADRLYGYAGDDSYIVDDASDRVFETDGGGTDMVRTSVSFTLSAGQEIETLRTMSDTGLDAIRLGGNAFANTLIGNAGDNVLNGGAGADRLYGYAGDDSYIVDDASDRVFETDGGGTDMVRTSVSFTLSAGQEIETLRTMSDTGLDAIRLGGNAFANTLIGNAGDNVLNGGAGADRLYGYAGDDSYIVDDASDRVFETDGGGTDMVRTSVSFTLSAGQEIETLRTMSDTGLDAIRLGGNAFANTLIGNAGDNVLNGGAGADRLYGYAGDDSYIVDDASDRVFETDGGGTDMVRTSVSFTLSAGQEIETLRTMSDTGLDAIRLGGNAFANTLIGNAGDNVLNGGAGADLLYGKGGSDTFAFSSNLGSVNVDRLTDFSVPEDTIQLARAVFRALTTGQLAETAFKDLGNAGAVVDASDRILYNHKNGALSYDADGNGTASTAVQFAVIGTKETLTHLDFLVA